MHNKNDSEALPVDIHDIEYLVCHVGLLWRRLLNLKIKSLGISGTEKRVLFCIARYPGSTQIQAAQMLDLEPQNLLRSLDKLEQQEWLEKVNCVKDRRIKQLYVTPKAKKILSKIQAISDETKPNILATIDSKKLKVVTEQLALMRENILNELGNLEK